MRAFGIALVALLFSTSALLNGQEKTGDTEPWIGTWKLNLTKSRYEVGKLPQSRTLKFERSPGGLKVTSNLVDSDGPVHIEFTAKYDGKEVVMYGPAQGATMSLTRIDGTTIQTVQKTNGAVSITTRLAVSGDRKTLTATATGAVEGKKFTNLSVYDRQP